MAKSREENILDRAANSIMRVSTEDEKDMDGAMEQQDQGDVGGVEHVESEQPMVNEQRSDDTELFADLVNKYDSAEPTREGDIINAKVVQTSKDGILLDVGMKSEGFMPWEEYRSATDRIPDIGETMNVYVMRRSNVGRLLLSKKEADFRLDWRKYQKAFEQEKPIEVVVVKVVKGGLLATVGSLTCFVPASHVSLKRNVNLKEYIDESLRVRVIELDKRSKNIVVSRKFLELEEREKRKEEVLDGLEEEKVVSGKVSSITKFGVFVDLGGIDGLIHPENLSWGWVKDPHEVVDIGQELNVKVLKLDRDKAKISLGLKQTIPDPWTVAEERYAVSSQVDGKITHLTNFGAFVEIEKGLEGLIHISDLSWDKRVSHPKEVVYVGQDVNVRVLDINTKDKRMALGLKQTQPDPWQQLIDTYGVGDVISGKVQEITDFGVFVNLLPGIDGLVHISELDSEYVHHPKKVTAVGESIEAEIVEIDRDKRRVRLSVKKIKEKAQKMRRKDEREERKERIGQVETPAAGGEDDGIVIGDFIQDELREKLKQEFSQ